MSRAPIYLLATFLFLWEPMRVAGEILTAFSSLSMRGPFAILELLVHVVVAALAVAAGWSLWNGAPHGKPLAITAVVLSAAVTIQSLYWTVLPRQTSPGDERIFAGLAATHAAVWVTYLTVAGRSSR